MNRWNEMKGGDEMKGTCLKKLETVRVTGLKLSRVRLISSPPPPTDDQLLRLSNVLLRRSNEPRRDHDPDPESTPVFRRNCSKLLALFLRSSNHSKERHFYYYYYYLFVPIEHFSYRR